MLVSGLDYIIDAFEAGWDSYESQRKVGARGETVSGALTEFWQDGRYFAQRNSEVAKRPTKRALAYRMSKSERVC
jgi:hypothetical protein